MSPTWCIDSLMSALGLRALALALAIEGFFAADLTAADKPEPARTQSPKMQWKRAKTVDASVVQRFCRSDGPERWQVVVFKDRAGDIGGYQASSSIMDSPVNYLDSQGAKLTMFHVFGDDAERAAAMRISSSQNFCVMHIRKIQPSRVRVSCTGTAEGCELRGMRSVGWRSFRNQVPG